MCLRRRCAVSAAQPAGEDAEAGVWTQGGREQPADAGLRDGGVQVLSPQWPAPPRGQLPPNQAGLGDRGDWSEHKHPREHAHTAKRWAQRNRCLGTSLKISPTGLEKRGDPLGEVYLPPNIRREGFRKSGVKRGMVFHQGGLSSGQSLIRVVFHFVCIRNKRSTTTVPYSFIWPAVECVGYSQFTPIPFSD